MCWCTGLSSFSWWLLASSFSWERPWWISECQGGTVAVPGHESYHRVHLFIGNQATSQAQPRFGKALLLSGRSWTTSGGGLYQGPCHCSSEGWWCWLLRSCPLLPVQPLSGLEGITYPWQTYICASAYLFWKQINRGVCCWSLWVCLDTKSAGRNNISQLHANTFPSFARPCPTRNGL